MNDRNNKSILIFTVHKAASMFMHGITNEVCHALSIPYYSPNLDGYFSQIIESSWIDFIGKHAELACFGQIRPGEADPCIPEKLDDYHIILHLRDPRDALTSLYFSVVYSHPRKQGGFNPSDAQREQWLQAGVDSYVLEHCREIKERYDMLLAQVYGNSNVIFTKYEVLVSDFAQWLETFLSAFSHVKTAHDSLRRRKIFRETRLDRIRRKLIQKYGDMREPQEENVHSHRRQVKPGDHSRKLRASTIKQLNSEFSDILLTLGYDQ